MGLIILLGIVWCKVVSLKNHICWFFFALCDIIIIGENMLGRIIGIEEDTVILKLGIDLNNVQNLINNLD